MKETRVFSSILCIKYGHIYMASGHTEKNEDEEEKNT